MEKIPYKPGDELKNDKNEEFIVVDLTKNGYLVYLKSIDDLCDQKWIGIYSKKYLDKMGIKLKTSVKWMPEEGEDYYFIDSKGLIFCEIWEGGKSLVEKFRLKSNNIFQTMKETEEAKKKIMSQ